MAPRCGIRMFPQVIDAMGDKGDCQPEHLSRKLAALQLRRCWLLAEGINRVILHRVIWGELCRPMPFVKVR
jgi:hypothetical protein